MKRASIEPGLLQVFRIFVGIRLLLIIIGLRLQAVIPAQRARFYLLFLLIEAAVLLVYLSWSWFREHMGRAYLPIAIIFASGTPIFEQAIAMVLRHENILQGDSATGGIWGLVILLLVPLILVSWQYNFRVVIVYIAGTAIFELIFTIPTASRIGIDVATLIGVVLVRSLLFLLIGSIIVRLMKAQREQREALARANIELARHATTIEQLATSRERNRLARELHDTLAHTLSGLAVQLEAMISLGEDDSQAIQGMLEQSLKTTRDGLREARRAIQALRASPLEDMGLVLALRNLATSTSERANLILDLLLPERIEDLDPTLEQGLYRIAEQAVTNVAQHANATRVRVELTRQDRRIELHISDDGCGFDPENVEREGRYGIQGMRERAKMIGGELEIKSQLGEGTSIRLIVEEIDDPRSDL
ncbi:MAG: sensor histidine kinase [Anaerolineaceae bacterium]|nr:MAG: sensor histidine kinase [Anaerolineaceae bacterium]